jgi:hypothetical protein
MAARRNRLRLGHQVVELLEHLAAHCLVVQQRNPVQIQLRKPAFRCLLVSHQLGSVL